MISFEKHPANEIAAPVGGRSRLFVNEDGALCMKEADNSVVVYEPVDTSQIDALAASVTSAVALANNADNAAEIAAASAATATNTAATAATDAAAALTAAQAASSAVAALPATLIQYATPTTKTVTPSATVANIETLASMSVAQSASLIGRRVHIGWSALVRKPGAAMATASLQIYVNNTLVAQQSVPQGSVTQGTDYKTMFVADMWLSKVGWTFVGYDVRNGFNSAAPTAAAAVLSWPLTIEFRFGYAAAGTNGESIVVQEAVLELLGR